jgi:predicted RNA-binding protein YlqC (UPF0109 family)
MTSQNINLLNMADHKEIQQLLLQMVQLIVDHPEDIAIQAVHEDEDRTTRFQIRADARDVGMIIGRQARNAHSLRILAGAMGMKFQWRYLIDIVEDTGQNRLKKL